MSPGRIGRRRPSASTVSPEPGLSQKAMHCAMRRAEATGGSPHPGNRAAVFQSRVSSFSAAPITSQISTREGMSRFQA